MDWFTTASVAPGLLHIDDRGHDSIFFFEGPEEAVLFDTGFGIGSLYSFIRTMTAKKLTVFNTHGHPDHARGNYQFPAVFMHPGDIPMVSNPADPGMTAFIRDRFMGGSFPDGFPLDRWTAGKPYPTPLDKSRYDFKDFSVDVHHTPGHSAGQVAYLIKPQGYLIIGDTIVHGKTWLHLPESAGLETYRQSVLLLGSLLEDGMLVFCGHSAKPIPHRIIRALPDFLASIGRGEIPGTPAETFAGDGMSYILEEPYGILMKPPGSFSRSL